MTQQNLRNYPTDELVKALKKPGLSPGRALVVVDELIQRSVDLPISESQWIAMNNGLSSSDRKFILTHFESFSPFTLHALSGKPFSEKAWFVSTQEGGTHSFNLSGFVKAIVEAEELIGFYWVQGRADWVPTKDLASWQVKKEPSFAPQVAVEAPQSSSTSSGMRSILLAVMSFVWVPGWLILLIAAIATGFGSFMGPLLPAVFSIFMILISVPMGIGLLQKKKWAWGMLIATTGFALFWFAGHFFLDQGSQIWIGLALFEAIILTLALTAKEQFA